MAAVQFAEKPDYYFCLHNSVPLLWSPFNQQPECKQIARTLLRSFATAAKRALQNYASCSRLCALNGKEHDSNSLYWHIFEMNWCV